MDFKNRKQHVIYTLGADVLNKVALPVLQVTPEIRSIAKDMLEAMYDFNGIGLAAPQIGHSLRLVVFDVPAEYGETPTQGELELLPKMPMVVINPEILGKSQDLSEANEGCLSVPKIYAPVVRPEKVMFKYMTLGGEQVILECGGLLGRCIQHELDHLDGTLFVDKVLPHAKKEIEHEIKELLKTGKENQYRRLFAEDDDDEDLE